MIVVFPISIMFAGSSEPKFYQARAVNNTELDPTIMIKRNGFDLCGFFL